MVSRLPTLKESEQEGENAQISCKFRRGGGRGDLGKVDEDSKTQCTGHQTGGSGSVD